MGLLYSLEESKSPAAIRPISRDRQLRMNDHPNRGVKDIPDAGDEAAVEECIEALDEFVATLDRYPAGAIAVAMGTYFEGLVGALLDEHQCTAEEVREFLREIESGILQPQGST
jgi:hypothetical protein